MNSTTPAYLSHLPGDVQSALAEVGVDRPSAWWRRIDDARLTYLAGGHRLLRVYFVGGDPGGHPYELGPATACTHCGGGPYCPPPAGSAAGRGLPDARHRLRSPP